MLLRAATVLTMIDEPLAPCSVRVQGDSILEIGETLQPLPDEEVIDLTEHVLLPGLINAHSHLDYTEFKGSIFPGKKFTDWLQRMNRLKTNLSSEDYLKSIQKGFDLLIKSGCTTVFNVEAFPELLIQMSPPPIRTWWFLELADLRKRFRDDESLFGALEFFNERPGWLGGFGVSPHAPYTTSLELYQLARKCSEQLKMPYMTHIAESLDEQEMFLNARGPLYDFLNNVDRDMSDCGHGSPLSHLLANNVLTTQTIAVHMNYLQEYDFAALKSIPMPVVYCPKCHAYFKHARFPLERLRDSGCIISLGTDSLASNDTLDMRAEIREARQHYPDITSYEWLAMTTINPAHALGFFTRLGSIRTGAWADLVAFKLPPQTNPYEAVIRSTEEPDFLMVNGKILR